MEFIVGIPLTVLACIAALGTWGRTIQIIAVIMLGMACVISDLKGRSA